MTAELIAAENGEQLWNGRYDGDMGDLFAMQEEITTSLSAALAPEISARRLPRPRGVFQRTSTAWDRSSGAFPTITDRPRRISRPRSPCSRKPSRSTPSLSIAHAYLATIQAQGIQFGWVKEDARIVGLGDQSRGNQRPARSSLVICFKSWPMCTRWEGITRRHWMPRTGRWRSIPTTWVRAGVLGMCHLVTGEQRTAIELFSMAVAARQQ